VSRCNSLAKCNEAKAIRELSKEQKGPLNFTAAQSWQFYEIKTRDPELLRPSTTPTLAIKGYGVVFDSSLSGALKAPDVNPMPPDSLFTE
jgi:hypothetical protein